MGDFLKNVLILFGGNSYEHEISCNSVNFIINNIDTNLFKFKVVGIDFDNNWYEIQNINNIDNKWMNKNSKLINNIIEYSKQFDIVFPMIHGFSGEDGKYASLFELFDIKYVGCDAYSSIICYDKLLTKLVLEKFGIPQVPYLIYNSNLNLKNMEYPVIVKPCKCGSSIGISIAHKKQELNKAIKNALKYDSNVLIEKFIKNKRELECSILEKGKKQIISDIGEIINQKQWYDYNSKYKDKTDTKISSIDESIKENIKKYSLAIFNILNCKDMGRIDWLYDVDNNKLYFNEINTIPGFTEISMYPKLLNSLNISNKEIITFLLNS